MQYDIFHIGGCGRVSVSPDLAAGHERGERIGLVCPSCGRYGEHEVRGALEGLE